MTLPGEAVSGNVTGTVEYGAQHAVTYSDDDYYSNYAEGAIAKINLLGSAASSESKNVSITGSEITILGGGTYVLSGESGRQFDWVCISTDAITAGETYTLSIDGTEVQTIEAASAVTTFGSTGRRMVR